MVWVGRLVGWKLGASRRSDCYLPHPKGCAPVEQASNQWSDPRTDAAYVAIGQALGKDDAEVAHILKDITLCILDQAWRVWLPWSYAYGGGG